MLGEEAGQALGTEASGRFGRRIALEEGERDRAGDVGEDHGGARPEARQQSGQLVRQRDPGLDQVVAATDQAAQGLDGVGLRLERPQAVAVGAQDVGRDVGIARVALGRDRPVARSARLDHVGMDRGDDEVGLDQGVDQKSGRPSDGNRKRARWTVLAQARDQSCQTLTAVADLEPIQRFALSVDHADGVRTTTPVDADQRPHRLISRAWCRIPTAGSPGGMLIDRRSGRRPTAQLPVARRGLLAAAGPRVSYRLSQGERAGRSRRRHGTSAPRLTAQATLSREVAQ